MLKRRMKSENQERGITLIALVIIIIVLLILAGVTISTLMGEDGIITKVIQAKEENEIASVKEQAKIDIFDYMAGNLENGEKVLVNTPEKVQEILNAENQNTDNRYYIGFTETGVKTPSGYEVPYEDLYIKDSEGEDSLIFDANNLTIGSAINTGKYGWKVTNYTVESSEMNTNVWRLFYQDNNYTYLIVDELVGSYRPSDYYNSYINGSMVSTVGQKLSPMLAENNFFVDTNTAENIRATAWLTDPNKWLSYENDDTVFAIGSPTAELYVASFNATSSENEANAIELGVGNWGYIENIANYELKSSYNHGIYCVDESSISSWWIASPIYINTCGATNLDGMSVYITTFSRAQVNYGFEPIRPIVCMPTSVFNNKYASSLVDN